MAAAIVAVSGCNKGIQKVTISGTISYKGQPLSSGLLKFVGPEGSTSAAVIQPNGKFIITDVVPGEVKVGVVEAPQGGKTASGAKTAPVDLPEKYRDPEKSGLKYTITPGMSELNIDIN
jgi:hypothetical protein